MKSRLCTRIIANVFLLMPLSMPLAVEAQLNENCTVSIFNRTTQVDTSGNWIINNLPSGQAALARATCTNNGLTQPGESSRVTILPFRVNAFDGTITLSAAMPLGGTGIVHPIPASLAITAPAGGLIAANATAQLTVIATYPDGSTADITAASTGTTYNMSNPAIAAVSQSGHVTGVSAGTVLIEAINEGTQAIISVNITSAALDSDGDGIPDAVEIANGLNPSDPTDALGDLDGDGLTNIEEYRLGTNMRNRDTDGDGISDLVEVRLGLNPLVADPTTAVQGHVTDLTGAALPGTSLSAFGYFTATTDASGNFQILSVPAGLGNIVVLAYRSAAGQTLGGSSASLTPVISGLTNAGTITLAQQTGTVTGVIINLSGQPVSGAQVIFRYLDNPAATISSISDSLGRYQFANIGGSGFSITGFDPQTGFTGQGLGSIALGSGTLVLNVTIGPVGSVRGTVYHADGITPYPNEQVTLGYGVSLILGRGYYATTDNAGAYAMSGVAAGSWYVNFRGVSLKQPLAVANGQTVTVNVTYPGAGHVQVIVRDSAGNPIRGAIGTLVSEAQFFETLPIQTAADGTWNADSFVAGNLSVSVTDPVSGLGASGTGNVTAGGSTTVTLQLQAAAPGTVRGVISFDGATQVPYANVFITQTDSTGQTTTFFPTAPVDDQGRYLITGLAAGAFTITAQTDGGLTGTVQGTVADIAVPVVLNVTLPPSSVVSVTILKSIGAPVARAEASLFSPGIAFNYDLLPADAQGVIRFTGVPAGPFSIYSYDIDLYYSTGYPTYGSSDGVVTQTGAGTVLNTNLTLPNQGTVSGTVYAADGSTPAAGKQVAVYNFDHSGGFGLFESKFVITDANGHFSVTDVQAGNIRVVAIDTPPGGPPIVSTGQVGFSEGTLQTTATVNVTLGTAVNMNLQQHLTGSDGYEYTADRCLRLSGGTTDGRLFDPFARVFTGMVVNGYNDDSYCSSPPYYARSEAGGRQIAIPSGRHSYYGDKVITRKIFVPASGGFVRYLNTVTNVLSYPMTIDLRIMGYAGPVDPITDLHVVVPPSVTNNTYAITDSALCCYPVIGHVFAGITPPMPVTSATFTTGFELVHFDWQNVTIQPGQTVTFMTFALQRDIADTQGATAQAEALVNLTDPNALTGITAAEKAQIVNFRIP